MKMQPGLQRAIPMGIIGFLLGALFVIGLRGLQSMDPLWDPGVGLIMAAFVSAATFVWGMGGFDPRMSTHPHEPEVDEYGLVVAEAHHEEEDEHEAAAAEATPLTILGFSTWQITTWTIALMLALGLFATLPGGFYLRTTADDQASTADIGFFTMELPFGGPEVEMSQLTMFIIVVAFTILSLAVIGGLLAGMFYALNRGVETAKATADVSLETAQPATATSSSARIYLPVIFIVLAVILYIVFYYVLIGLVLPNPPSMRILLSVVNALLFAGLVVYPLIILRAVGRGAGWLARVLRGLPEFLFQRD